MRPSLGCWRWRALGKIQKLSLCAAGLQLSHYRTNLLSLAQKALNSTFFGVWPWEWYLHTKRFNLDKSLFLSTPHIFRPTCSHLLGLLQELASDFCEKVKTIQWCPFLSCAGLLPQGLPSRRCWLKAHSKSCRTETSSKDHLVHLWTSRMSSYSHWPIFFHPSSLLSVHFCETSWFPSLPSFLSAPAELWISKFSPCVPRKRLSVPPG